MSDDDRQGDALEETQTPDEAKCWAAEVLAT